MHNLPPSNSESAFVSSIGCIMRPHAPRLRHTGTLIHSIFHFKDTQKSTFSASSWSSTPDKEHDPTCPVARFFRQYSTDDPSWMSTIDLYDQLCIREEFITWNSTTFDCAIIALALVVVGEGMQHERPLHCFLRSDGSQIDQLVYREGEVKR